MSESPEQIKTDLFFFCFMRQSAAIFRASAIWEYGLFYNEDYLTAEDHELWCRASHLVKIAKVPEALIKYRWHMRSTSHAGEDISRGNCVKIMRENLSKLDISATNEDLMCLCRITCHETFLDYRKAEKSLDAFYDLIIEKNRALGIYSEACLIKTLDRRMYWKRHRIRRWAAVLLKSIAKAISNGRVFYSAIYLELNGFSAVLKKAFNWR